MGQVITLMPLLNETVFIQEPNVDMFQNAIQMTGTIGKTPTKMPVINTSSNPTLTSAPTTTKVPSKLIKKPINIVPERSPFQPSVETTTTDFGFQFKDWTTLTSCGQIQAEVQRLQGIRNAKVRRHPDAIMLLDQNISYGNSILALNCMPQTQPDAQPSMGGGFDMGGGGFDMGGGDFQQPSTEQYEVLGYDATGCPIYGYDENGTPLYGVDQFGNIITDPTLLPCGMVAGGDATNMETMPSVGGGEIPKGEEMPFLGIKDKTTRTAIIVVGAIAIAALIIK